MFIEQLFVLLFIELNHLPCRHAHKQMKDKQAIFLHKAIERPNKNVCFGLLVARKLTISGAIAQSSVHLLINNCQIKKMFGILCERKTSEYNASNVL